MASRYSKFLRNISMEDGSVEEAVVEAEESAKEVDEAVENDETSNLENETEETSDSDNETESDEDEDEDDDDEESDDDDSDEEVDKISEDNSKASGEQVEKALESFHQKLEQINKANQTVNNLEDLSEDIKNVLVEDGGLTERSAKLVETSIENILALGGLSKIKRPKLPSLESYGGITSRRTSTEVALEGLGDIIETIKQAIKKAFKMVWDWLVGLWRKIFGYNKDLYDRLKDLREELKKVTELNIRKIEDPSINKFLSVDKKPIHSSTIHVGLLTIEKIFTNIIGIVDKESDFKQLLLDFISLDQNKLDHVVNKLSIAKAFNIDISPKDNGKTRVGFSETLLGEMAVTATLSVKDEIPEFYYALTPQKAKQSKESKKKHSEIDKNDFNVEPFNSFTKTECENLIDASLKVLETMTHYSSTVKGENTKKLEKLVNEKLTDIKKLLDDPNTDEVTRKTLRLQAQFCQTIIPNFSEPIASLAVHITKVIAALEVALNISIKGRKY